MLRKGVSRKAKPSTEAPVNGGRKAVAALTRQRFRTNSAICWETRSVSGATRKSDNASSAGHQQERPNRGGHHEEAHRASYVSDAQKTRWLLASEIHL